MMIAMIDVKQGPQSASDAINLAEDAQSRALDLTHQVIATVNLRAVGIVTVTSAVATTIVIVTETMIEIEADEVSATVTEIMTAVGTTRAQRVVIAVAIGTIVTDPTRIVAGVIATPLIRHLSM